MLAPVVGGGNDDAVRERSFTRGGEETVDVPLLDLVVLGVQLALDGVVLTCALSARNQINARILTAQALPFGPIDIRPHLIV
ncbi:hypothetical protein D9M72_651610 [compost metagenome]